MRKWDPAMLDPSRAPYVAGGETIPAADYNLASGPTRRRGLGSNRTRSIANMRAPADLTRSRRIGLSANMCPDCWAFKDQGFCRHESWCSTPGTWIRTRTGPLVTDVLCGATTSLDTGWHP